MENQLVKIQEVPCHDLEEVDVFKNATSLIPVLAPPPDARSLIHFNAMPKPLHFKQTFEEVIFLEKLKAIEHSIPLGAEAWAVIDFKMGMVQGTQIKKETLAHISSKDTLKWVEFISKTDIFPMLSEKDKLLLTPNVSKHVSRISMAFVNTTMREYTYSERREWITSGAFSPEEVPTKVATALEQFICKEIFKNEEHLAYNLSVLGEVQKLHLDSKSFHLMTLLAFIMPEDDDMLVDKKGVLELRKSLERMLFKYLGTKMGFPYVNSVMNLHMKTLHMLKTTESFSFYQK